jgi:2-desacetyl-2-hydroxyethyl bacteriochlorophyllide A dehydrogenase
VRAAAWMAPEVLEIVERDEPSASSGQAVVRVAACGICGSDLHSLHDGLAVRAGQVMGHEFCGEIVSAPGVAGVSAGDRVAVRPLIPCGECERCRGGELQLCEGVHGTDIGYGSPGALAERVLVPRAVVGTTLFPLPNAVDDAAGALVEPLAVALHVVGLANVGPDDVVLVIGAGTIGLAVTRLLRHRGVATLVVAEMSARRRERALRLGADQVIDPAEQDPVAAMRAITGPGGYGLGARADAVFECAGAQAALAAALKCVRQGGTIMLSGIYAGQVGVHLNRIVEKEIRVQGSVAYRDEFAAVIALMAAGVLRSEDFVSHTYPLGDVAAAFATQGDAASSLKVQVQPNASVAAAAAS